jgi:putative methionine-R-sulfoxide reductase with GAF domain/anti-sigma regulatory factor (Ser/Thr protein kinase)
MVLAKFLRTGAVMKKKTSASTRRAPATRRTKAERATLPGCPSVEELGKNILFRDVEASFLRKHFARFTMRTYKSGEVIFDEYSKGRDLYLLCEGRVRIKKYTKFGVESLLAVLHPTDFFGELSLIDGLPRSARAEALDDCVVASLNASTFRDLLHLNRQLALNLLNNLAVRLRTMDQTFVMELGRNSLASKTKLDKLNTLIEATKILNSAIELDKVLSLILDVASRSVGADRGTLYLMDYDRSELWSKIAQGDAMVEIRLPVGRGIAGYVARTGETVNITDAYRDPRFNPDIDRRSGYTTNTMLCMPMRDKEGKIVGVFQLLNKQTGHFGPEDEAFIDALSIHAALALENARLAESMIHQERLAAVGRMASSIIHDIKNPLATMRLYAELIAKRSGDGETGKMASEIIKQVDRFISMTQEVLDFSRGVSEIHREQVDVGEMMDIALRFIESDMGRRSIRVVRKFEFTGSVTVDPEKIARALYNLAGNAADAMPHGGTLTIRTAASGTDLLIEVTDTGAGIPEEIRTKIFEPFFTHGKKHGTGLGLAIVKKIAEDHRGRIEMETSEGSGTTFRMVIPQQ